MSAQGHPRHLRVGRRRSPLAPVASDDARRGAADCGEHRQVAGAVAAMTPLPKNERDAARIADFGLHCTVMGLTQVPT
jgi:hypothetical protein